MYVEVRYIDITEDYYTFNLDVGNDDYYEYQRIWDSFELPIIDTTRIDETGEFEVQAISCDCNKCTPKVEAGERYCMVPVKLRETNHEGRLIINNSNVLHTRLDELKNVTYGETYPRSSGGCWRVNYGPPASPLTKTFSVPDGMVCGINDYFNYTKVNHNLPETNDALVDAVYRLFNETMDQDNDGVLEDYNPDEELVAAEGNVKGQALWGPLEVRLMVWV
jgi:hypothetical protein